MHNSPKKFGPIQNPKEHKTSKRKVKSEECFVNPETVELERILRDHLVHLTNFTEIKETEAHVTDSCVIQ